MKIDFESRLMPNVKFKLFPLDADEHERKRIFNIVKELPNFPVLYFGYRTNFNGSIIYNGFKNQEAMDNYDGNAQKEVSIYEAIPKLIPDGMRYNKELDKLVPDVISASAEYCGGIKVEFEKVVDYTEQILKRENGFFKADKEKINFSLVDPYAYEDLGKCLTIGAKKYSPDNWKLGDIESYIAALDRHLIDIKKAVLDKDKSLFIDKDTALQHGANVLCNAMFIHYFIRKELEEK